MTEPDPKELDRLVAAAEQALRRLGFTEEACAQIALAVDEALCNVIRHGYERRKDAPIWLSIFPLGQAGKVTGLRIVVEDEARQVDPEQIKSRDLDEIPQRGAGPGRGGTGGVNRIWQRRSG